MLLQFLSTAYAVKACSSCSELMKLRVSPVYKINLKCNGVM
jgi:hypothetical protein